MENKQALLSICIPTYNRINDLIYNVNTLIEIIKDNNLYNDIIIIISDNCSPDHTELIIKEKIKLLQKIQIELYRQSTNIGGANNMIFTINKTKTEFCMLLGDDDYINANYLVRVLNEIKNNRELTSIIPAVQAIYPDKKPIEGRGRDLYCKTKYYQKGFINCCANINRVSQLSGLVFKKKDVIETYILKNMNNMYPQIFFVLLNCLNGPTLHLTDYPVLVTQIEQSKKGWSYGTDGLMGDKFENCTNLGLSSLQVSILEIISLIGSRYLLRDIGVKLIPHVLRNKNTTFLAGCFLLMLIPYMIIEKCIKLIYWRFIDNKRRYKSYL
jgi:glycosyltransferase involved in cell wall biosynthesis